MTNSQRLASVRKRLEQWLRKQAVSNADDMRSETAPRIYSESILIREGFYCGRQFNAGAYRAVWFMEEDELKISDRNGKWVCSLRGDELIPEESPADIAEEMAEENRDVIPMPMPTKTPGSTIEAETADDRDSDEQEIRRAA